MSVVLLALMASLGDDAAAWLSDSQPPAETPHAAAVADTGELMDLFLQPLYEELRRAVRKKPDTRREFADVYRAATRLAEAANLLFFRPANRYTIDPEWPRYSAAMRDAAAKVAEATFVALRNARPDDFVPVRASYDDVSRACNACHRGLETGGRQVRP